MSNEFANLTKRHRVRFWGRNYVVSPRLVSRIFGDGQQIIWFSPLNTRPDYYVVRIGSDVSLSNYDENCFADVYLDEIYEAIEDEFGPATEVWVSEKNGREYTRHNPFPALDDDSGSSWGPV
jgi:hypothetical protein